MTTLYHGGTVAVPCPLVTAGRDNLDFGKGFYLTNLREQAESWAKVLSLRHEGSQPVVSIYDFDFDAAVADGCRYLAFPKYDLPWLRFVVASRSGKQPWRGYDIIEGGIANDRVADTVEDYLRGRFTARQAIGQLRYAKPTHQMCLLTQGILDKHLTYKESYTLC